MQHTDKREGAPSPLSSARNYEIITERGRTAAEFHDMSTKFLHLQVVADNYLVLQKQDVPNNDLVFLCQKRS
jgi:hypothetical protein